MSTGSAAGSVGPLAAMRRLLMSSITGLLARSAARREARLRRGLLSRSSRRLLAVVRQCGRRLNGSPIFAGARLTAWRIGCATTLRRGAARAPTDVIRVKERDAKQKGDPPDRPCWLVISSADVEQRSGARSHGSRRGPPAPRDRCRSREDFPAIDAARTRRSKLHSGRHSHCFVLLPPEHIRHSGRGR
jgi:hypothetical protein